MLSSVTITGQAGVQPDDSNGLVHEGWKTGVSNPGRDSAKGEVREGVQC